MILKGAQPRARELRAAANRLHHEVTWAIDAADATKYTRAEALSAVSEIAETLAILRAALNKLDEIAGPEHHANMAIALAYYAEYRRVPR